MCILFAGSLNKAKYAAITPQEAAITMDSPDLDPHSDSDAGELELAVDIACEVDEAINGPPSTRSAPQPRLTLDELLADGLAGL